MLFRAWIPPLREVIVRRDLLGALFFAIAAISGKLAATKLLGSDFPSLLLEVRLWTTIAAVGLLFPFVQSVRWNRLNAYIVGSIFVLAAYLILRAPFGASSLTAAKVVDLLYLLVLCYLMLIVASDAVRLTVCGMTILITSGVLFVFALTGIATDPVLNGVGWAAIGGPLTFYRLEFLGFSCALWMILRKGCHPPVGIGLLGIFLFATLASLSKAAYGAAAIVLLVLIAGLIAQSKWRPLTSLVLVSVSVFAIWHIFLSSNFYKRTSAAFASEQTAPTAQDFAALEKRFHIVEAPSRTSGDQQGAIANSGTAKGDNRRFLPDNDGFLAPGFSFLTEFRWCVLDDSKDNEKATVACHKKTVVDRSQRLFFLYKALETPTLFGHGVASFRVLALNPGAGYRLEHYDYPHDVVLELLYEAGIVGVGLLVAALMFSVAGFFRFVGREPALLALGGYGLFIFISSLAAGDFYDFRLFWFTALTWSTVAGLHCTDRTSHASALLNSRAPDGPILRI